MDAAAFADAINNFGDEENVIEQAAKWLKFNRRLFRIKELRAAF
jgi:hypothetical protein